VPVSPGTHLPICVDAGHGEPALEALVVDTLPSRLTVDLHPLGQGVDGRDADAVQAAGDLVAAAAELAAGVQGGHDHWRAEMPFAGGYPPGCRGRCRDGDALIGVDDDVDAVAGAGQGLVDRVVDHLVDQVVQRADVGAADVHAGAAAHGLQALQDLDGR
jgi:hypothetical protein